jgi:two-component system, NarL family, nitrate/nitrite response regulator NarL
MRVRVLVVSDVQVVHEGLRLLLAQHQSVEVVSATDARHASALTERLRPDVVLFDASRCRGGGGERVKEFVGGLPCSKVVAFGVTETDEQILALAAAGTAGYVRDSAESGDLVRVLQRVMCDELPCSARAAALLYRQVAKLSRWVGDRTAPDTQGLEGSARPCLTLSRRELEIAHLVECGLSNKEIARRLGIEAATVKNHVHHMCAKLNVHRRGEAIARIRNLLRARNSFLARASSLPASSPEVSAPALDAS